jgi:hypothetical protein
MQTARATAGPEDTPLDTAEAQYFPQFCETILEAARQSISKQTGGRNPKFRPPIFSIFSLTLADVFFS